MSKQDNVENIVSYNILSINKFFGVYGDNLQLPAFQRPYEWEIEHVAQLIDDMIRFRDYDDFRLGTIILHKEHTDNKDIYNIIDGQQRIITIILILKVLGEVDILPKLKIKNQPKTIANIKKNYAYITGRKNELDKNFILNNCKVVVFVVKNQQQAFQLFDTQNTRGKDLYPHDLLKAYHISKSLSDDKELNELINYWESIRTDVLHNFFGLYLYRIRRWARGQKAGEFSKKEKTEFYGIDENELMKYEYSQILNYSFGFIEKFNETARLINYQIEFPYQIDGVIINGKKFFERVKYLFENFYLKFTLNKKQELSNFNKFNEIIEILKRNGAKNVINVFKKLSQYYEQYKSKRSGVYSVPVGDLYVHRLFEASLMYYINKFGFSELDKAACLLFRWAYKTRFCLNRIFKSSIEKRALGEAVGSKCQIKDENPFAAIRNSYSPKEFFNNFKLNEIDEQNINEKYKNTELYSFYKSKCQSDER